MPETFFQKWRNRFRGAWDVLIGRAWAGYGNPSAYDFDDDYPGSLP